MKSKCFENITGVVLAGGRSSRFDGNKAFASWGKKQTLLESVVKNVSHVFDETLVVVKEKESFQGLDNGNVKVLEDLFKEHHSIGGIYSGLFNSNNNTVFVCGCDMPFIKSELLKALALARNEFDAVIPRFNNTMQPLCGLYSKSCLGPLKNMIDEGNFKIIDLFGQIRTLFFEEELLHIDPQGRSFLDIDTVEDYKFARGLNFRCATEES